MKYQLVLQMPFTDESDIDHLYALEEELEDKVRSPAFVDGHDFGSGEMNIFIHTNKPEATFAAIRKQLAESPFAQSFRAGYRELAADDYAVLWPESLESFSVT